MTTPWTGKADELDKYWRRIGCVGYRKTLRDKLIELWKPGYRILEGGCGSGLTYEHLPDKMKPHYVGLDATQDFVDVCNKRYPKGEFILGDLRALKFPDNSFDIGVTCTVLQHILEWKKAARELIRVSKRYIVSIERTHLEGKDLVRRCGAREVVPNAIRRRFNPKSITNLYSRHGKAKWSWTDTSTEGYEETLGLYILEKPRGK